MIYDSTFNVMNKFTLVGNSPHYGIEIEIEFNNEEDKLTFCNTFDYSLFLLKREPSILCGIEIVSAPCSMNILIEQLSSVIAFCNKYNAKTSSRTGIHVHVTKPTHQLDIFRFVNNSLDREEFISFSGRLSDYARYTTRSNPVNKGRGYCVNIYPKHTIEFRLFASKLDYEWVIGCLYFCQLIISSVPHVKRYSELISRSESYPDFFKKRLLNVAKTPVGKRYPLVYPESTCIQYW
jgi:hypothetical protein